MKQHPQSASRELDERSELVSGGVRRQALGSPPGSGTVTRTSRCANRQWVQTHN